MNQPLLFQTNNILITVKINCTINGRQEDNISGRGRPNEWTRLDVYMSSSSSRSRSRSFRRLV